MVPSPPLLSECKIPVRAPRERSCEDGCVSSDEFQRKGDKGLADETRVKHARRVQRSFRFVKCGAATEPCELVL